MTQDALTHRDTDRTRWMRRAQFLALATVVYNTVECVIALFAGRAADSASLVGFGLDSLVEVSSGLIILWQFRHPVPESRERAAQRAMAVAFWALATFVTYEAATALLFRERSEPSPAGIGLAIASLLIMPFLAAAQRRTGRALGSAAVVADSMQALLCTYLSGVLLLGLVANAAQGWWWADPLAALIIAAVAAREGAEAWRGEDCGCSPGLLAAGAGGAEGAEGAEGVGVAHGCAPGCRCACCSGGTS